MSGKTILEGRVLICRSEMYKSSVTIVKLQYVDENSNN